MNYSDALGGLSEQQGNHPSVFVFSVHKAGSTLLSNMMSQVCQVEGIPSAPIPSVLANLGLADGWSKDRKLVKYFDYNLLYYGFRFFPELLSDPQLDILNKKFILLVRDPRDALVSQYFSFSGKNFSHNTNKNNKNLLTDRALKTAHMGIDEYVLHAAVGYHKKLKAYKENLNLQEGLICKYEDVYFDKFTFLKEAFEFLDYDVREAVLERVAERNDIRPDKEDVTKHIRKGEPGDHRNKLKPNTISQLNKMFNKIGERYGYDLK